MREPIKNSLRVVITIIILTPPIVILTPTIVFTIPTIVLMLAL